MVNRVRVRVRVMKGGWPSPKINTRKSEEQSSESNSHQKQSGQGQSGQNQSGQNQSGQGQSNIIIPKVNLPIVPAKK